MKQKCKKLIDFLNKYIMKQIWGLINFLKKHIFFFIVIAILIVACIPLALTTPGINEFKAQVPTEFNQLEAKKESDVFKDGGIMSTYIATKQIDSSNVKRVAYLGIGNHIFHADAGVPAFVANSVIWFPSLMNGTKVTVLLTLFSVTTGIFLSIFLALGKMSKIKPISWFSRGYIFFFRGTPLLMQLYFVWFGLPLIFPALTISDRFLAAWITFSLNGGAYCAEIIRAAIESIDKGQFEASKAVGLNYRQTMLKVIIPQTYRRLIPPLANEFIMVLKDAALTSTIALADLSKVTSSIMSSTGEVTVFLLAAAIYLVITAVFSKFFVLMEKKFSIYD